MKTIAVDDEVYEALKARGRMGNSFNDVLRRLLGLDGEQVRA